MEAKPLPNSKQEAFLECPLYGVFTLEGREDEELVKFFRGGGTLDAWCLRCQRLSVFSIESQLSSYNDEKKTLPHSGVVVVSAFCTRKMEDSYSSGCRAPLNVIFFKDYKEVRKIGQNPSAADLALGSLDEAFEKELDAGSRREMGTAIGLQAHGVGIGSFVYLRRIFESLLEEAHKKAKQEKGWDEEEYNKARIHDRIGILREYLPARLVSSANLYGLLSVGIHELSETKCLDKFALVKGAIEFILKERHEEKRYEALIKAVDASKSSD